LKTGQPLCIDDFKPLAAVVDGYELKPGCAYLILCNDKHWDGEKAASLLRDIHQMHPDLEIAIVASPDIKDLEVREKPCPTKNSSSSDSSGSASS